MRCTLRDRGAKLLLASILCTLALVLPADAGEEVDVELVLAVDVSRSMAMGEQIIQRRGYVDAIRSPEFLTAVRSGFIGRVALTDVSSSFAMEQIKFTTALPLEFAAEEGK